MLLSMSLSDAGEYPGLEFRAEHQLALGARRLSRFED